MPQNVTPSKCCVTRKELADATRSFPRDVPENWAEFGSSVDDNFRISRPGIIGFGISMPAETSLKSFGGRREKRVAPSETGAIETPVETRLMP
jgi:hypothetical protein